MMYKILTMFVELADLIKSRYSRFFIESYTTDIVIHSNHNYQRYVVVCLYEMSPRPDLKLLFDCLSQSGFGIIAVVSNDAADQYQNKIDLTVKIAGVGRDFLAYQQGYDAMKSLVHFDEIESVCFLNDSVWFFQKYQQSIIDGMLRELKQNNLVVGTKIFDEIPHVSGWFFAIPLNKNTNEELNSLFKLNFARKSRDYNIRKGEHQILSTLKTVNTFTSLDKPNTGSFVSPHCYEALIEGTECFYIKGDSTIRTNPIETKLEQFLAVNTEGIECDDVLRWISVRSDILLDSPLRLKELVTYRSRYYENRYKENKSK